MEYSIVDVILLGLGMVFVGLICLIFLTKLLSRILSRSKEKTKQAAKGSEELPPMKRQELIAACSAAIATVMGAGVDGLRILSIKKID